MQSISSVKDRLAEAEANFSKGLVVALNQFYELEARAQKIYVTNRVALDEAIAAGKMSLDPESERERLLHEHFLAKAENRKILARNLKIQADSYDEVVKSVWEAV